MEGLLSRADESSLDCKQNPKKTEPVTPSIDLDSFSEGSFLKSETDKHRFLFSKFLGNFQKEICAQGCVCSLPAMPDDGHTVDWLKLFLIVREKGGYNAVSENGLWDSVAAESGLNLTVASLVKLIYVKYLFSLERWLERFVRSEDSECASHFSGHCSEMGAELKRFLLESKKVVDFSLVEESVVAGPGGGENCVNCEESMHIDSTKEFSGYEDMEKLRNDDDLKSVVVDSDGRKKCINVDEYVDIPSELTKSVGNSSDVEKMCNEDEAKSTIMEDSVECKKCSYNDDHVMLDSNDTKEKFSSHKRMLDEAKSTIMEDSVECKKCSYNDDHVMLDSNDTKEKFSSHKRMLDKAKSTIMEDSVECKKCSYNDDHVMLDSNDTKEKFSSHKRLLDEAKSTIMEDSVERKKCSYNDDHVRLDSNDATEKFSSHKRMLDEAKSIIMEDSLECKKCSYNDDHMMLDSNDTKEKVSSHKRKPDSTCGMLNWVIEVAKNPCHPVVGSLPESSKWKSYGREELWKQMLLFREAVFCQKADHSSSGQSKRQKIHPCMYADNSKIGYYLRERSSCSKNLRFGNSPSKGLYSPMTGIDKPGICNSVMPGSVFDCDVVNPVPIGPHFQVEVPAWTGVASVSDEKWLGTRVWPLEKKEQKFLIERDRIGKGRQDSCGCPIQGSPECVKFHVAERRSKVRLELGSAFYKWKFDKMGEEVASAWNKEDQKMFSSIVKLNPSSLQKCFWDKIYKHFHKKSREELVCYYYNVFLLQSRAYQNRFTPRNIDSDDESESVGKGMGQEVTKPCTSILISPKKSRKKSRYSS